MDFLVRNIYYSSRFKKSLKRMPKFVREAFLEREGTFLESVFDPALETHKLHGKYKNYWGGVTRPYCGFPLPISPFLPLSNAPVITW